MPRQVFDLFNDSGQLRRGDLEAAARVAAFAIAGPVGLAYATIIQGSFGNLASPDLPQWINVSIAGTQKADKSYPFTEVYEDPKNPGSWLIPASPVTDTVIPLFEYNDTSSIPSFTTVRAWLSEDGSHYLFAAPGIGLSTSTLNLTATCTGAGGSAVLTNLQYGVAGIAVGQIVSGTNIPPGATVAQIDTVNQTITLKQNCTGPVTAITYTLALTGIDSLTFAATTGIICTGGTTGRGDIQLLAASPTQNGMVTTIGQTFAGQKTFQNGVIIGDGSRFVGPYPLENAGITTTIAGTVVAPIVYGTTSGTPGADGALGVDPADGRIYITGYPTGSNFFSGGNGNGAYVSAGPDRFLITGQNNGNVYTLRGDGTTLTYTDQNNVVHNLLAANVDGGQF